MTRVSTGLRVPRVARSLGRSARVLEDQLHAREINLHILTGICAGLHRPTGPDKMLFMVTAMAAEMERELIRGRTLDGLAAAHAQGRRGGRPPALDPDTLAVALARRARGESVTAIAAHLGIGRSTSTAPSTNSGSHPLAEDPVPLRLRPRPAGW